MVCVTMCDCVFVMGSLVLQSICCILLRQNCKNWVQPSPPQPPPSPLSSSFQNIIMSLAKNTSDYLVITLAFRCARTDMYLFSLSLSLSLFWFYKILIPSHSLCIKYPVDYTLPKWMMAKRTIIQFIHCARWQYQYNHDTGLRIYIIYVKQSVSPINLDPYLCASNYGLLGIYSKSW